MSEKFEPYMSEEADLPLSQEERIEIANIANGQADVTHDGGQRSPTWTPLLIDVEEYERENPYIR